MDRAVFYLWGLDKALNEKINYTKKLYNFENTKRDSIRGPFLWIENKNQGGYL
jgi:hypothetical protein